MNSRGRARHDARFSTYYPSLRHAGRLLLFLSLVLVASTAIGGSLLLRSSPGEVDFGFGLLLSALGLFGLTLLGLLYLPVATWLRVGGTGITYCVGFSRREMPWNRVRELRLLSVDRTLFGELVIEVISAPDALVQQPHRRPRSLKIDAKLFGWSADALAQEMDAWRARNVSP